MNKVQKKELAWLFYLRSHGFRLFESVVQGKVVYKGTIEDRIEYLNKLFHS
jgi:hypothetical protein